MRNLSAHDNERIAVTATLRRYGLRAYRDNGKLRKQTTALLEDIASDNGIPLASHCWIRDTRPLRVPGVRPGRRVRLSARVIAYQNRYGATSYTLTDVKDVKLAN